MHLCVSAIGKLVNRDVGSQCAVYLIGCINHQILRIGYCHSRHFSGEQLDILEAKPQRCDLTPKV